MQRTGSPAPPAGPSPPGRFAWALGAGRSASATRVCCCSRFRAAGHLAAFAQEPSPTW
ncbi:hypothetical protein QJS66_13475 [Kocuria rhizophila]|nr:hypothetical protein QJS66_13475 [Kocuria rhizophila]